jgi:hypothetical protein
MSELTTSRATRHRLTLRQGGMVRVQGAEGLSVQAIEGRLWIIQDADVRDYEIEAGESLAIGGVGVTLIQALTASTFALLAPQRDLRGGAQYSVVGAG